MSTMIIAREYKITSIVLHVYHSNGEGVTVALFALCEGSSMTVQNMVLSHAFSCFRLVLIWKSYVLTITLKFIQRLSCQVPTCYKVSTSKHEMISRLFDQCLYHTYNKMAPCWMFTMATEERNFGILLKNRWPSFKIIL